MKHNIAIKRVLCGILVLLMALLIPAQYVQAKETYDFAVNVHAGYNQEVLLGYGAPFEIEVTNNSSTNFSGYLQMIVPGQYNNNVLYEEELTLGVGETKTVKIVAGILKKDEFVNVRMVNKKHTILWKELEKINVAKGMDEVRIGVLSDDFSALSYFDRQHFLSDKSKSTTLVELSANDFPTDYLALDMLDVILISDFSTDLLTKEQINALNIWIQKGGLLMIGTGSTSNKTLSGLKGTVVNDTVTATTNQKTTLGLLEEDYSYLAALTSYSSNYNNNGYGSSAKSMFWQYYSYDISEYQYQRMDSDNDGYGDFDYDHDGFSDQVFGWGGYDDGLGQYYDAYGNMIDSANEYLFDGSAFTLDPVTNEISYKYYDERYGVVDDDDLDYLLQYSGESLEDFTDIAYTEYCNLYTYDPKWYLYDASGGTYYLQEDLDADFDAIYGKDYEEFLRHFVYQYLMDLYYGTTTLPDLSMASNAIVQVDYDYIDVDVAGLDDTVENIGESVIYGDTSSGDQYPLARVYESGDGYVAIFAVDFTKNPIPRCPYAGEFARNFIERTIGLSFLQEASTYSNKVSSSYGYSSYNSVTSSEENITKAISSAPVPPVLIYVLVLGAYMVAILVTYVVSLKKRKTWGLWLVYPIMAIAVSILIFCIGFSTRVIRLNANAVTLLFPGEVTTKQTDYISAIVPKAKEYSIEFTDSVDIDKSFDIGKGNYWLWSDETDYDTYCIQYKNGFKTSESIITNKVALENQLYKTNASFPTQGGIEIEFLTDSSIGGKDAKNLKITNNYSTVLEDVIVQIMDANSEYKEYYFSKLKPGESAVVSTGEYYDPNSNNYYSSYKMKTPHMADTFSHNSGIDYVLGLLLGNIYKGVNTSIRREAICRYVDDAYSADSSHVTVVAFPKSDLGVESVNSKKCKFSSTQAIIVREDYHNIQIDH